MTNKEMMKEQRVLLVDDDQSIRLSLSYFFRNKVGSFKALETAEQALDHLRTETCDIVLCDYRLPGMDGLAFFQELHRRDLPVLKVLITAHGDMEVALAAIKTGIHDFILKPFNGHTVAQSLIKLLEKRPRQSHGPQMDGKTLEEIRQHLNAKHEALLRKITHRMNNVLQGMVGNADMGLLELGNSSQLTKRFDNIIGGIDEMMKLTKEVTFTCEPGKINAESIDVAALVDRVIIKYIDILKNEHIKLYKWYGEHNNVTTYPEYLYDIIDNTFYNIIQELKDKYKGDKILNLYINKESSSVKIKIADNSRGMIPDILDDVTMGGFTTQPFGNCLGPQIVDILSRTIGATIKTINEIGRGTSVEITIPLLTPGVAVERGRYKLTRQLNKL
ncbi:MAG: hybrid sensor histidine kinase/response regulator [Thermodesulfobacteriota bacterium]